MYIISRWIIYHLLDVTHQAHITGNWKILISCHMCAYQVNNIIFGFFQAMQFCHTIIPVTAINLEGAIHSRTFFLDSGNSSGLQLCCKSRAKSKIEMKKLCCVLNHDLTFQIWNFYWTVIYLTQNTLFVVTHWVCHIDIA